LLLKLSKNDVRFIGRSVSDLVRGITGFSRALDDNVLIKAMRGAVGEEQGGIDSEARDKIFVRKLKHLKGKGIEDPNIDLFLAVLGRDSKEVQDALERGADPSITDGEILSKYKSYLGDFKE
jgi:hypothetical protein